MNSEFKYMQDDFKPRNFKLLHMDLSLNFLDDKVLCQNELTIIAQKSRSQVVFDCKVADVLEVGVLTGQRYDNMLWEYDRNNDKLIINLNEYKVGSEIKVKTKTVCYPSDSLLEGIYKDTTYKGPQQYISQCQQWGFQRIFPVFDDCTAKCTMRTTIEADAEYTHLISNGNVCRETNPDGLPVFCNEGTRKKITYELNQPMVPYLFLVAVGTWDVLSDEIVYPSGHVVKLEYLVPPGRLAGAEEPMQILKDSIIWQGETQNYEYPFEVYRTICMEKSNWGGMENLGNTTIVTEAALIDEFTGDSRIEYAHAVIIHEFEHNQCGSEVTMETPFDVWLNEAFTVDVERQYMHSRFDSCRQRLSEVQSMREPVAGPLAIEDGGHSGRIVREGFNDPDELIDGLTYVKSAEVIRMLRLIIGKDNFIKAKDLYFNRYRGGNANSDQFLECFEEISKLNLTQFKTAWLYQIGYPVVSVKYKYNQFDKTLKINICQKHSQGGDGNFVIPLGFGAVNHKGQDVLTDMITITKSSETITYNNVEYFAFISWNRDCCFYGVFDYSSISHEKLFLQARFDPSIYNRVEAMQVLTDIERIKLIKDINAEVSKEWLDLYGTLIEDLNISDIVKSYMLNISDQPLSREYIPLYKERGLAKEKLTKAVCMCHLGEMLKLFNSIDTYGSFENHNVNIGRRRLKFVVLKIITTANAPKAYMIAEEHFNAATDITDKLNALTCINMSMHPDKESLIEQAYKLYVNSSSGYRQFLAAVAASNGEELKLLKHEEQRPSFDPAHPGHISGLFLAAVSNNRLIWTDEGLKWMKKKIVQTAEKNEYLANRMVGIFRFVSKMKPELKDEVTQTLEEVLQQLNSKSYVAKSIKSFLS
jgi:aminopeptidase N